jgi:acetylornithine deacetylase/succinyl-diaminopimelate desuccinylase-like protein
MESGYNGVGYRNSVPSFAIVKLNFRLVAGQEPKKIIPLIKKFIRASVPDYVDVTVSADDMAESSRLSIENPYAKKADKILGKVFKKKVLYKYSGGTLPIFVEILRTLKIPIVSVPLANEDCRMHAPNENFEVSLLKKGLQFSREFLKK